MNNNTTQFDAVEKIWSGPKAEVDVSKHQNFGEFILRKLADDDPERILQIDGDTGEKQTVAEIRQRTIRCAQHLMRFGCTQNQRIAIIARNHHNLTPLIFSAFCIGSPITPMDVIIVNDGASHILQRVEPSFIFCDADVILPVQKIAHDIGLSARLFTVNNEVKGFDSIDSLIRVTGDEDSFVCTKITDAFSHAAVIACSSGTTGLPKSICISHALLAYVFSPGIFDLPFTGLCFSSLYWFSGVLALLTSACGSTRVFTSQPYSTDLFFDLVERYEIQYFVGPSCQIQAFLKSDRCKRANLSSLMICNLVGGFVPSILLDTMKEIIPNCIFMTAYGLTELGGGATITSPGELEEHPNAVGCLMPGVQMKIIDENTNENCGIGESGEVYVKIHVPSMGYLRDDVANRNAFDKDGYLITGDIGHFDESGRLHISGRKKDIFKSRGFSIWPAELEDIIQKSPAVRYVCVVSVFDEEIMSDLPAAVVVKNEHHSITQEEIYTLVAGQLASYKRLDGGVYFVDELPMTASGKVIQSKVKPMAQNFYQIRKQKKSLSKL